MSEQLATIETPTEELGLDTLGQIFFESGFFPNVRNKSQAIVKIMAGRENGFGPFTSMASIHLIPQRGGGVKPELGADLVGTRIKSSGKYDYRVLVLNNDKCEIQFYEKSEFTGGVWEKMGVSSFSRKDAEAAGLTKTFKSGEKSNYDKFARNMYFSRAITNGQAWYCPDVFQSRIYSEGELPRMSEGMPQGFDDDEQSTEHDLDLEFAYTYIEEKLDSLEYAQPHRVNSFTFHLDGVNVLRECHDIDKLREYGKYLLQQEKAAYAKRHAAAVEPDPPIKSDQQDPEEIAAAEEQPAINDQELLDMIDTVKHWMPDAAEAVDKAVNEHDFEKIQVLFGKALDVKEMGE